MGAGRLAFGFRYPISYFVVCTAVGVTPDCIGGFRCSSIAGVLRNSMYTMNGYTGDRKCDDCGVNIVVSVFCSSVD